MNRWTVVITLTRLLLRITRAIYRCCQRLDDTVRMLDYEQRHPEQKRGTFGSWWRFHRGR